MLLLSDKNAHPKNKTQYVLIKFKVWELCWLHIIKTDKKNPPSCSKQTLKTYFFVSAFGNMLKYLENFETNYNQSKVDSKLGIDNAIEITIN